VCPVSSELSSEKQRHGHCKCAAKHTNVCAHRKLRIIIRETTAWPLEMRWEHTNERAQLRILSEKRRHGRSKCDGNTLTCVPTVSSELSSEKQRHGRCNALGTYQRVCPASNYYPRSNGTAIANAAKNTYVCAHCKLRIIIREATVWPLEMHWEHTNVRARFLIFIREATARP
jgi:hypothetical protein